MVLAVVDDLLFASKIRAVAAHAGERVVFVRSSDRVIALCQEHQPRMVFVDLDREPLNPIATIASIRATPGLAPLIVGFGAHVHADRLRAAREAGCDQALARSGFVTALPSLLKPTADEM